MNNLQKSKQHQDNHNFYKLKNFIEKNFNDFSKELRIIQIEELREANNSLSESVQAPSKAFDMPLTILKLEHNNFLDFSINAKIQVL